MSSPRDSAPLPPELWAQVFDHLTFYELLTASHICRLARSNAHAHPTFSRDIELSKANDKALRLFRMRLTIGQSDDSSVSLRVTLNTQRSVSRMTAHREVLGEICSIMPRITKLDLDCSMALGPELRAILESPAPRLSTLRVCMLYSHKAFDSAVPRGFLSNHAPELRSIEFDGLDFVEEHSHEFPSVQRVVCSGDSLELLPKLFPNAVDVVLGPRDMDPNEFDEEVRQYLLRVPELTLNGNVEDLEGPSDAAIDFLAPRAQYALRDVETGELVSALQKLAGSLALQYSTPYTVAGTAEMFRFTSLVDGKVRVFIDTRETDVSAVMLFGSGEPDAEEMLARIVHFSFTIGWSDDYPSIVSFSEVLRGVLQYLTAVKALTICLCGECETREENWPTSNDLEDELTSQRECILVGQDLETAIPYSSELRCITVTSDSEHTLSHADAEGLVVVAGYLVDRTVDVEIRIGARVDIEPSARRVLEGQFLAINADQ